MNQKEFALHYKNLYKPLCMFALRIVEDTEAADDVVQEAFASVWRRLNESESEPANFRSYTYMAVRNQALMHLRALRPEDSIDELAGSLADVTDEEIDMSERDALVWQAVDDLPQRCREIFLMSKRDGLTYAEIAAELGLSVKTVENQISKALKNLRSVLQRHGGRVFFLPFL